MATALKNKKVQAKRPTVKFTLDCGKAVDDLILDAENMEKYFHDRIKVDGKINNLDGRVNIGREKSKITISAQLPFSKRYVKYLAKRYLKKQQVRDFLRVVATNKNNYELRYFSMVNEENEE